ncbi:MAG: hypothetical protein RIQ60_2383 [Pseudomonadota bacterium]|jgi:hypothetical protein
MLVFIAPGTTFPSALKEEYLQLVASWLLEEWSATEDDMVRETDTPYTRGTARFGRQKERISLEYRSGRHPWLVVHNNGLDIVFSICGFVCRFSNDDADAPKKRAVTEVHPLQMSLLEEVPPGEAARFVFVVDRIVDEEAVAPRVLLLGFASSGQLVCRWTSEGGVRAIGEASPSLPAPVEIDKPVLKPKRKAVDGDTQASAGP